MRTTERGSALLAVLWLSAALAAVALALSMTVRGETERESTAVDGLRSYYLASGAIERAELDLLWSMMYPARRTIPQGAAEVTYEFPSGEARVEIIPETAKLDVNHTPVERLFQLLEALGVEPGRARDIALAIDDWRKPNPLGDSQFDAYYLSLNPSFHSPHASFHEIEELLLVKGVTPDIFYGTWIPQPEPGNGPRLVERDGLADCLTVYGSGNLVDINTARPAVLAAMGLTPATIAALVARRQAAPFTTRDLLPFLQGLGAPATGLRVGGNSIVTFRATARLRLQNEQLSDLRRTVAAQVKYLPAGYDAPFHVLRWYDTAWSY